MLFYLSIISSLITFVMLLYNYNRNKNSFLLAGYLLPVYLYGIKHYMILESDSILGIAIFHGHFSPIFLLPGAMLYLYVRNSLKNEWRFTRFDFLHFIPFIVDCLNVVPFYLISWPEKMETARLLYANPNYSKFANTNLLFPFYIVTTTRAFLFMSYIIASSVLLLRHWKDHFKTIDSINRKNLFRWLCFLISSAIVLAGCTILITLTFFGNNQLEKSDINDYHYTLIAYLILSIIPLVMVFYPQVLYGIPVSQISTTASRVPKKEKPAFKTTEMADLAEKILLYFETEKPYLNPSFSLDDLSVYLGVPKYQLYECFNKYLNKKFIELRTNFRIAHAKKLLLSSEMDSMSLEGIWNASGFSSKTNFFTTFKEETGVTPIEFIQQQKLS